MFCNNCGAQITPDQKFCNNCGVALHPHISYNPQGQMPPVGQIPPAGQQPPMGAPVNQPAAGQQPSMGQQPPVGTVPPMGQQPMPGQQLPKKKPVWPIILIIIVVLLLVSILSVWGVNKIYKSLVSKYLGSSTGSNTVAGLIDDEDQYDDYDDVSDMFPDDFGLDEDFGDFDTDDFFGDIDEFAIDGDYSFVDYDYATVMAMDDFTYVETNHTMSDETQIRPGKTMGALCDYIDSEVLEDGKKIDRELLYDLVSVHIVSNNLVEDDKALENNMMYCLSLANEFSGSGVRISDCMYDNNDVNRYYYDTKSGNEYDTWIVDTKEGKIYMNDGGTEYKSAGQYGMFSSDTLAIWLTVVDTFYGIE